MYGTVQPYAVKAALGRLAWPTAVPPLIHVAWAQITRKPHRGACRLALTRNPRIRQTYWWAAPGTRHVGSLFAIILCIKRQRRCILGNLSIIRLVHLLKEAVISGTWRTRRRAVCSAFFSSADSYHTRQSFLFSCPFCMLPLD